MAQEEAAPDEKASFAEIVEAHWSAVYRLLYHMTGRSHDAEELTQEAFLKALNAWSGLERGSNIRAWLMRIGSNLFLDAKRREQRRRTSSLPPEIVGAEKDPSHSLEVHEQSERVRSALTHLSELTRLVFHLRATEDMSFREIGEAAGISEEAARWHMHQARVKLIERLKP